MAVPSPRGATPRAGIARIADVLLVAFLVCLALATAAQVRHNQAAGPHGRAPHDRPVKVAR